MSNEAPGIERQPDPGVAELRHVNLGIWMQPGEEPKLGDIFEVQADGSLKAVDREDWRNIPGPELSN